MPQKPPNVSLTNDGGSGGRVGSPNRLLLPVEEKVSVLVRDLPPKINIFLVLTWFKDNNGNHAL